MAVQKPGKIGLIGAGAVGSFYGLQLFQNGQDIHFYLRSNFEKVRENGFSLVHHKPEHRVEKIENPPIYSDTHSIGACDWIIIATKATVNDQIGELIKPMVSEDTSFLSLQNGMGNVENLAGLFGKERIIVGGLCFTCINRTHPDTIESLLPGYIQFGEKDTSLSEKATNLVKAFECSGIKVSRSESLDEALWRKLCWNVPFNGLSIIGGGITTDLILNDKELRMRALQLMIEIQHGAQAHGITIEDSFIEKQFSLTELMGPYKPSSLIDFQEGKAVEVEAIWGEPIRRGLAKGIAMPELTKLYDELLGQTR